MLLSGSSFSSLRQSPGRRCSDVLLQGYRKVIVVGHSFGTALAMRLAAEKPAHIAGLVLVGAYVPPEKQPKPRLFSLQRWLFYLPTWVSGFINHFHCLSDVDVCFVLLCKRSD